MAEVPRLLMVIGAATPPGRLAAAIIETSGLALPKPVVQAFAWPEVKAQVTVDGVLVVVDAPAVLAGRFATDPAALARQRATLLMLLSRLDPAVLGPPPLAAKFT